MTRICQMIILMAVTGLSGCATNDGKSLLVAEGDDALSCTALHQAFAGAGSLGENAPARRRWLKTLIAEKDCRPIRTIGITVGASVTFD